MRAGSWTGWGLIVFTAAGCGQAHVVGVDAGSDPGDAAVTHCRVGDTPPLEPGCIYVSADHVCGDAVSTPVCTDGVWQCPAGSRSDAVCWCSGLAVHDPSCTCTPSGWTCPPTPLDAGIAPVACPADPSLVIGTPCAVEGQSCGSCPTPCSGFCNQATCVGHVWQELDYGCADTTFACGPALWCGRFAEYCQHVLSDVAGVPDDYRCAPFPQDCANDCTCFPSAPGSGACADDHAGGVTITLGGG